MNVVCLEHDGNTIWHRSLTQVDEDENQDDNAKVISTSPIMLGDVDGNGSMDIVVTAHVAIENKHIIWIYAIDAKSGSDLQNFPREQQGKPESRPAGKARIIKTDEEGRRRRRGERREGRGGE